MGGLLMVLRTSNQPGRNGVHVEVSRLDEMPGGIPDLDRLTQPDIKRDPLGRPADAESHRELSRRGGRAKAGKTALSAGLGLEKAFADPTFQKYRRSAENFANLHVRRLAETVGGGECGPAPSSVVMSASLQLA